MTTTRIATDGFLLLADGVLNVFGVPITYRRGPLSVQIQAAPTRSVFSYVNTSGDIIVVSTDRDYLLRPSSLVLGGNVVLPRVGDIVEEVIEGVTYKYTVSPFQSTPHWRYETKDNSLLRVLCKKVPL